MKYNDFYTNIRDDNIITKKTNISKILNKLLFIELLILAMLVILTYFVKGQAAKLNSELLVSENNIIQYHNDIHVLQAEWNLAISPSNINKILSQGYNNNQATTENTNQIIDTANITTKIKNIDYLENNISNIATAERHNY